MMQAESLLDAIEYAKTGTQSMTRCPAHDDGAASLHVSPGTKQPVVMMCHANCETPAILEAGGIDFQMLLKPKDEKGYGQARQEIWTPEKDPQSGRMIPASHVYEYTDEDGALLYQVLRVPKPNGKKTFYQRQPDKAAKSGWKWNMNGARRVLYHLPEVLKAKQDGETIYLVEGEKDVESLRRRGFVATTGPMGAGKWEPEYTEMLSAANIIIVADADEVGREHARAVKELLDEVGSVVSICEAKEGKDVTDHLAAGHRVDDLIETVPAIIEGKESYGMDILDAIEREIKASSFVIPRVLAAGDRWLLTGFEGHGKSTFCRQLAIQVAAGIHPWTLEEMPPQKVLIIDSENHPDQVLESWRDMIGRAARHGRPVQRGMLILQEEWDHEINLNEPSGKRWLIERVRAHEPALVVIGPLYNLANKDLSEHAVVGEMKSAINEARGISGAAFIMEHHAPHRAGTDKDRSVRPYGSSTFLKWPDFGYGLKPEEPVGYYELQKTRFPRVRSRHFPGWVRWGKEGTAEWPWMPVTDPEADMMGFKKKAF
ncbi:DNA primase/helicase [Arthrobacter phage BruhMoment]|nr:DNA primase/helicase [Arthrobacter phage BruhMoment]